MSSKFHKAIFHALLAAALYAVSIPFSKLLLTHIAPTMLAAFLYIGAGVGMAVMGAVKQDRSEEPLHHLSALFSQCSSSVNAPIGYSLSPSQ